MLGSTLTLTLHHVRRYWKRLLGVYAAAWVVLGGAALFVRQVVTDAHVGSNESAGGLAVLLLATLLVSSWAALAAVRVPVRNDDVGEALAGSIKDTPKLLIGGLVLLVLVVPALLVVPWLLLVAAIASDRPAVRAARLRGGLGVALRIGVLQLLRNLGLYVALVVVAVPTLTVSAVLFALPIAAVSGAPTSVDVASLAALDAWRGDAGLAVWLGALLAALPWAVVGPSLTAAIWAAVNDRADLAAWRGENLEPVAVTDEISPVVAALLKGPSTGMRRRVAIPPRAERAGRLPGPGVMQVADVALPPGTARRSVDMPTLELDAREAAAGSTSASVVGASVVAPAASTMWVSAAPIDRAAATWKQLAAGFSNTGLWPLLVPVTHLEGSAGAEQWYDRRGRRERDSLDASAAEQFRIHLLESLESHSPLTSTQLLARSAVARGELRAGSGRRPDALAATFEAIGAAHLALVAVTAPGEAVHRTAWPGASAAGLSGVELALLLGSWEERHGALLVGMGPASLTFAVLRPPATFEEAIEVVAEHHALCPDEAATWGDDRSHAERLVNTPTWRLSWR